VADHTEEVPLFQQHLLLTDQRRLGFRFCLLQLQFLRLPFGNVSVNQEGRC
jgi:hypothetical protein